jgi:hypothetical protein
VDVASWLRNLRLGQYEAAFREKAASADVLYHVTTEDLAELAVAAIGYRTRPLVAIAALRILDSSGTSGERRPLSVAWPQGRETDAETRRAC